jgi:hypothetical protein
MHVRLSLLARVSAVLVALILSGCAGTTFRPPSGKIGGIPATKAKAVLRTQQEFKMASITFILPAGNYRAAFEDESGIYFEAPSKVIMRENFLGMKIPDKPFDGGIFLERSAPQTAKIYTVVPANEGGEIQRMLHGGRPGKPMPTKEPVVFELTRSSATQ